MGRTMRVSKGKTMMPCYFVFCEGQTEVAYVEFLRAYFRVPIQIIARKSDSNITAQYISNCKKAYATTERDRTYLMFDLDVPGMLAHLQSLKDATLLVSNPCFEVWLLLHHEPCTAELSSDRCVKRLLAVDKRYKKGLLLEEEKQFLLSHLDSAIERAQKLHPYDNPSTTVFRLIQDIREWR